MQDVRQSADAPACVLFAAGQIGEHRIADGGARSAGRHGALHFTATGYIGQTEGFGNRVNPRRGQSGCFGLGQQIEVTLQDERQAPCLAHTAGIRGAAVPRLLDQHRNRLGEFGQRLRSCSAFIQRNGIETADICSNRTPFAIDFRVLGQQRFQHRLRIGPAVFLEQCVRPVQIATGHAFRKIRIGRKARAKCLETRESFVPFPVGHERCAESPARTNRSLGLGLRPAAIETFKAFPRHQGRFGKPSLLQKNEGEVLHLGDGFDRESPHAFKSVLEGGTGVEFSFAKTPHLPLNR